MLSNERKSFFQLALENPGLNCFRRFDRDFTIHYPRAISAAEADLTIACYIAAEKKLLFDIWLREHPGWKGDREERTNALWEAEANRPFHIGGGFLVLAFVEDLAMRLLGDQETITVGAEFLLAQGEDRNTSHNMISSYRMQPEEIRRFRIEAAAGSGDEDQLVITRLNSTRRREN